ncbi:MAG: caspase family protein [Pseudomonadales bacterium]|nr:caspase family protein [Pseudomonadales bacterium]
MNRKNIVVKTLAVALLVGCSSGPETHKKPSADNADSLFVVDCLLPAQVRKLGGQLSYQAARKAVKTSAADCEIRGGEYVAFDRADYATALKVWLPSAKAGDADAQNYVGQIYEQGLGLAPDYEVAALWYGRAAEQNLSKSQINLGNLYEKGLGVKQDSAKALNLYRAASGLDADTLQYASAVETARVSQEELSTLKALVEKSQRQLAAVQSELKDHKGKLFDYAEQLTQKQSELNALQTVAKVENVQKRAQLEQDIVNVNANIQQERQKFNETKGQLSHVEDLLASNTSAVDSSFLMPSIEIIDPPMNYTRGFREVSVDKSVTSKEVLGRIDAPQGVESIKVNGQPTELDELNLFWVNVPINQEVTPVKIDLLDKAAHAVSFTFNIYSQNKAKAELTSLNELLSDDGVNLGNYHALVIGNDKYMILPGLKTAVNDAEAVAQILEQAYGFKTMLLTNATRYDILLALNNLRETLGEKDNLLIYYAGHGELDSVNDRGYWLPVDAEPNVNANWISNVAITDILNAMNAKHVMVVADSCYSGTLSASAIPQSPLPYQEIALQKEWVELTTQIRARTVLTSGGVQPVLDGGGGDHSIFAAAFLKALQANGSLLDGNKLYRQVLKNVRVSAVGLNQNQAPQYAPIKHAGHEAGEFFFQRVDKI